MSTEKTAKARHGICARRAKVLKMNFGTLKPMSTEKTAKAQHGICARRAKVLKMNVCAFYLV
jgi:hypothetical protein